MRRPLAPGKNLARDHFGLWRRRTERLGIDPTRGATGSVPASVSACTMVLGTGGQAARGTRHPAKEREAASTIEPRLPAGI